MAWTVQVNFGSGLVDITADTTSLSRQQVLHHELRSAVNTATFVCTDLTRANLFLSSDADLPIEIQKDSVDWFSGYVRPTYESTTSGGFDGLRVECVDSTWDLRKTIDDDLAWQNYTVSNTASVSTSIVHQLLVSAGYSTADMSLTTVAKTVSWYTVSAREARVYLSEIDELLYEFGYALDVNPSGVFVMRALHPASLSTSGMSDSDIVQPLKLIRRIEKHQAARITWFPVETLASHLVFSDRTGQDGTNPCSISIGAGVYYPTGASASEAIHSMFAVEDADLLTVTSPSLVFNKTGALTAPTTTFGSKSADIRFLGGSGGGVLTQFDIVGDAVIKDRTKSRVSVCYGTVGTERILAIETRFIEAKADADALASNLVNYFANGKLRYTFEVDPGFAIEVGQQFSFSSAAHSFTSTVRVVELTENEHGTRHALCEGVAAYATLSTSERGFVRAGFQILGRTANRLSKIGYVVGAPTYTGATNSRVDGTADEVQINAGITALTAEGGGVLLLTQGSYSLAAPIVLKANVEVRGCGGGTVLITAGNFSAAPSTISIPIPGSSGIFRNPLSSSRGLFTISLLGGSSSPNGYS